MNQQRNNERPSVTPSPASLTLPTLQSAFTLIELLVVITIIIVISSVALPTLNAFKPDILKAASNQLVNDLAYARRRAISDHTTVYVVFMPPVDHLDPALNLNNITQVDKQRMLNSQYRGYAMYEKREIADQPGASTPHWISNWRNLPDGTAIPLEKFGPDRGTMALQPPPNQAIPQVPFFGYWTFNYTNAGTIVINPDTNAASFSLDLFPTVAFDYRGSLIGPWNGWISPNNSSWVGDCVIPLTRAHVNPAYVAGNPTLLAWQAATLKENPPGTWTNIYTHVLIDGPTGRAKLDRRQVQ